MKSEGNFPHPFEFYMAAQNFFGPGHLQSQPLFSRYFCFLFEPFFHFFVFYLDIKFIVHLMHYSINIVVIIIIIILLVCFVFKNLLWYCQEFFLFVLPSQGTLVCLEIRKIKTIYIFGFEGVYSFISTAPCHKSQIHLF